MDWLQTLVIILLIAGVTGLLSLFVPRRPSGEEASERSDGPVIPAPFDSFPPTGAGGPEADEDGNDDEEADADGPHHL